MKRAQSAPVAASASTKGTGRECYAFGEQLIEVESHTIDYKSGSKVIRRKGGSNELQPGCADDAKAIFKDKVAKYVNAFINSDGGRILFGVEDDRRVSGCNLDENARGAMTKYLDQYVNTFDPQVDKGVVRLRFVPITGGPERANLCVVEVSVSQPVPFRRQPIYYMSSTSERAYIRLEESNFEVRHDSNRLSHPPETLVREREAEFRKQGRDYTRTWRHVKRLALPFDGHIKWLRQASVLDRKWIFEELAVLIEDRGADDQRIVCLAGREGSGLSTLAASLARMQSEEKSPADQQGRFSVLGAHFCTAALQDTMSDRRFVENFAASLVCSSYVQGQARNSSNVGFTDELLRCCDLAESNPEAAFRGVIRSCVQLSEPKMPLVFVLDGLFDTNLRCDPICKLLFNTLQSLRAEEYNLLKWLVFVITVDSGYHAASFSNRGVDLLIGPLHALIPTPCVLNLDTAPQSALDVKAFVRQELTRRLPEKERVDSDTVDEIVNSLGDVSNSNFQIARAILVHCLTDNRNQLLGVCRELQRRNDATPSTDQLYPILFEASFSSFDEGSKKVAIMLLEVLLAARRPMSEQELADAVHSRVCSRTILSELKVYLNMSCTASDAGGRPGVVRYALQQSILRESLTNGSILRESLTDGSCRALCSLPRGHAMMASFHLAAAQKGALLLWTAQFEAKADLLQHAHSIPFHVFEGALHFALSMRDNSGKRFAALVASPILIAASPKGETAIHLAAKRKSSSEAVKALQLLLEATEDVQPCIALTPSSNENTTPLHLATAGGGPKAVELLLRAIDCAEKQKTVQRSDALQVVNSALRMAAIAGAAECVRALLEWGALEQLQGSLDERTSLVIQRALLQGTSVDLEAPSPHVDREGITALCVATQKQAHEAVEAILRAKPPDAPNYVEIGRPLDTAVGCNDAKLVALLLEHMARPDVASQQRKDKWPLLPIGRACMLGYTECLKALLDTPRGALTINSRPGPPRRPALLEAVWNRKVDCVKVLLDHAGGTTTLYSELTTCFPSTVAVFASSGPGLLVDLLGAEDDGGVALHEACYWGWGRGYGSLAKATEIVGLILHHHKRRGIPVDTIDNVGCSPLCYAAAAEGDQGQWVKMLMEAGANGAMRSSTGKHWSEATKLLLCSKPAAEYAKPWGGTPLEEAVSRGHENVVEELVAAAVAAARASPDSDSRPRSPFGRSCMSIMKHILESKSMIRAVDLIEMGYSSPVSHALSCDCTCGQCSVGSSP